MTEQMQAVSAPALGPLEHYRIQTVPMPAPGPGEVRIRIAVAGLGYADGLLCQGLYQVKPPVPFIPACEFAGVIDAVGPGVDHLQVGDRVAAQGMGGGLAEYVVVPVAAVTPVPAAMSLATAALFWVDYTTAFHALRDRAGLRAGEKVLVLGAAGGLGLAAIQIARALGAYVIAAASSPAKRQAALQQGAAAVVDYTAPDWRAEVKALAGPGGLDVVFDPVGGSTFEPAFRSLGWGGRHLVLGFTGGAIPALPINLALLKGAALVGVDIRQFALVYEPARALAEKQELAALYAQGLLQPASGTVFAFAEFDAALRSCAERQRIGKTLVQIGPDSLT